MKAKRRITAVMLVGALSALLPAAPAHAAATCSEDANQTLTVTIAEDGEGGTFKLRRSPVDDSLEIARFKTGSGWSAVEGCTGFAPTSVVVTDGDASATSEVLWVDESGGSFGGLDLDVTFSGGDDALVYRAGVMGATVAIGSLIGSDVIDVDADGTADISVSGLGPTDLLAAVGTSGNDLLRADGVGGFPPAARSVTLVGGDGEDELRGSPSDDALTGGHGNDTLYGFEGNDVTGSGWNSEEAGHEWGDDSIHGGAGADQLYGDAGSDDLYPDAGSDDAFGGPGADWFDADDQTGDETFDGGDDADTISYAGRSSTVRVSLDGFANDGDSTLGENDNVLAIEAVLGGSGDDHLLGSSIAESLNGGGGNDALSGGGGNDLLAGGAGNDALGGEAGDDRIFGQGGVDAIAGGDGIDVAVGGAGPDPIGGGPGNDRLEGSGGNDELSGNGGSDALFGGAGYDECNGGPGPDAFGSCAVIKSP